MALAGSYFCSDRKGQASNSIHTRDGRAFGVSVSSSSSTSKSQRSSKRKGSNQASTDTTHGRKEHSSSSSLDTWSKEKNTAVRPV